MAVSASTTDRDGCDAPVYVAALEQIRRMRGGTQPHLMRCSDGNYYVVKFPNNPQGSRVLVNELLAARLAALLGLPVASTAVVMVHQELIDLTPDMVIELGTGRIPCLAGRCFGSRLPVDPHQPIYDLLALVGISNVTNRNDFLGMMVFDLWTCNTDRRQVVIARSARKRPNRFLYPHRATMIDQGFCFNAAEWNFPDSPLRGQYYDKEVYRGVEGIQAFEPWLNLLESEIDYTAVVGSARGIPLEWYGSDTAALDFLLYKLNQRRKQVRGLLCSVRNSDKNPFPNWVDIPQSKGSLCANVYSNKVQTGSRCSPTADVENRAPLE